jgi:hypothetical protein
MMKKSISIYYSKSFPEHRKYESNQKPGWWWKIGDFHPAGPFDNEIDAIEYLLEEFREEEKNK